MKKETRDLLFNIFALICSLWFLMNSSVWYYCINLIIAYPVGLLGFYIWYKGKKTSVLSKIILWILILGLAFSIVTFFLYYFDVW